MSVDMRLQGPHVTSLHIYPVKGLHGLAPASAMLSPWGMEGDRRWMVVTPDNRFLTQRTCRDMALVAPIPTAEGLVLTRAGVQPCPVRCPDQTALLLTVTVWKDQVQARDAGEEAASWLTRVLGRPCRLVWMHRPELARIRMLGEAEHPVSFADGYPLLLANTASLEALNDRLPAGQAIPMSRFRANIVISSNQAWAEDGWRRLCIGGNVVVRVVAPCSRCVVTSIDQNTAQVPNPKEPLATLASFRRTSGGVMFAQNAVVEKSGLISVGDRVEVLEEGPSNLLDNQNKTA
ncbi:MAG: MOSC N-terminal beta barrel domain-containing protein [Acetobacter syzygii]|uniref:MOSC domain-containing protein n=1 Tax=Acetobacter syzygii TaxID=146476 RepID=UPI0024302D01|nr:MOSC N-terminal beta barrel domain-containing protein [Acetobacter syzygii]